MEQNQNQSFPYPPLPSHRSLRLVGLENTSTDNVSCHLLPASLDDDSLTFETVSYVWGDPIETAPILLNGQPFHVTVNLRNALRCLRETTEPRILWVDAICINQSDIMERSQQVSIMKLIYERSKTCLMWVGESTERIELAMDLARKIPSLDLEVLQIWEEETKEKPVKANFSNDETHGQSIKARADVRLQDSPILHESEQPQALKRLTRKQISALDHLFRIPAVWNRVWIMQELAMAPNVIIVSGHSQLSWTTIERFLDGERYADAFHSHWGHGGHPEPLRYAFANPQIVQHQRNAIRDMKRGTEIHLLDVVSRFRFTYATDPRDKIFALLGMCSDTLGIRADYSKSLQEVFIEFASVHINKRANLDLLCQSQWMFSDPKKEQHLPSWVPNFSDQRSREIHFAQRGIFNAGTSTCRTPCRVGLSGELTLEGIFISTVGVGALNKPTYGELYAQFNPRKEGESWDEYEKRPSTLEILLDAWMPEDLKDQSYASSFLEAPEKSAREEPNYQSDSEFERCDKGIKEWPPAAEEHGRHVPILSLSGLEAYWRTLIVDCKRGPNHRIVGNYFAECQKHFQEWVEGKKSGRWVNRFPEVLFNTSRWTFVVLENGLYSMVPPSSEAGDIVVVLNGAKVPVTLRPGKSENGKDVFTLVGSTYVHGIMDGEAMEWVKERKFGFEERDFVLI